MPNEISLRTGRFKGSLRPLRLQGQSTVEYAVVIAVIVAALVAMNIYMKRGVQGKLRSATDQVGEQYRPGLTTGQYTIHSESTRLDELKLKADGTSDGTSTSTLQADEIQTRFGSETVDTSGDTKLF